MYQIDTTLDTEYPWMLTIINYQRPNNNVKYLVKTALDAVLIVASLQLHLLPEHRNFITNNKGVN